MADAKNNKILKERFQRQELFALEDNFKQKNILYFKNHHNKLVKLQKNE